MYLTPLIQWLFWTFTKIFAVKKNYRRQCWMIDDDSSVNFRYSRPTRVCRVYTALCTCLAHASCGKNQWYVYRIECNTLNGSEKNIIRCVVMRIGVIVWLCSLYNQSYLYYIFVCEQSPLWKVLATDSPQFSPTASVSRRNNEFVNLESSIRIWHSENLGGLIGFKFAHKSSKKRSNTSYVFLYYHRDNRPIHRVTVT